MVLGSGECCLNGIKNRSSHCMVNTVMSCAWMLQGWWSLEATVVVQVAGTLHAYLHIRINWQACHWPFAVHLSSCMPSDRAPAPHPAYPLPVAPRLSGRQKAKAMLEAFDDAMKPLTDQLRACQGTPPPDFSSYNMWLNKAVDMKRRLDCK